MPKEASYPTGEAVPLAALILLCGSVPDRAWIRVLEGSLPSDGKVVTPTRTI